MISQTSRHARCSWLPLGLNHPRPAWSVIWQWQSQTLMRSCKVVKGVEADHPATQLLPVFAKTPALPRQGCQGMAEGQVQALNQTGADLQPKLGQTLSPTADPLGERVQAALLLLFDQLGIDQLRVWFEHCFARAAAFMTSSAGFRQANPFRQSRTNAQERCRS